MSTEKDTVVVVGAGIFGVTAALELLRRGHSVTLMDPGPIPHPLASSTDISKMIRMDYGADELYMAMMEESFPIWRSWNEVWGEELFHEDGFLILAGGEMEPGEFEYESHQMLKKRGHDVELLDSNQLKNRLPAWTAEDYPEGYINPVGGWAESGKVVSRLVEDAIREGLQLAEGAEMAELLEESGRVVGVRTVDQQAMNADWVIVAGGAWTPTLLPDLADVMWAVGQPVLHFQPETPSAYRPPEFLPWSADIARTGWYGFPAQRDGTLKIANHGPGRKVDPRGAREIGDDDEAKFRAFFRGSIPELADAPLIDTRLCLYCDTWDGNFWIDHDPNRPGLILSTGGSGHGFKFAPVLGLITADVLEGNENPYSQRFRWRSRGALSTEDARFA